MLLGQPSTFRRLWVGQSVSVIGDGMQRLALLWWAKQHGGNGLLVAVAMCTAVPVVVGSPIGGWLADRRDRRMLLLGADLVRLTTSLVIAGLLLGAAPPRVLVCGLVAIAGLATAVFDPTYAAAVPSVVDADDLPAANGLNMAQSAMGGLAGPILGGLLIGLVDVGWVMAVNAVTFLWSAACVAGCRLPRPAHFVTAGAADVARDGSGPEAAGLTSLRRVPGLARLVALASALNMFVAPVPVMIAALAVDRFHTGPRTFGLLEVLLSGGLLVGSLLAGRLASGRLVPSFLVLGACIAATGALPLAGSCAVLFAAGLSIAVANTEAVTRFQRTVPAEMHGRAFGVLGALAEGLRPAGLVLAGPLLAAAGVTGAFVLVGSCVVAATLSLGSGLGHPPAGTVPGGSASRDDEDVRAGDVRDVRVVGVHVTEAELA